MNIRKNAIYLALALLPVFISGCGSGSTPAIVTYGSQAVTTPYFAIHTVVLQPIEDWPNATITGYANTGTVTCNPTTDTACIADVGSNLYALTQNGIPAFNTNSNGFANFATDAIGALWYFTATDNNSTQCPNGSSLLTTYTGQSTGAVTELACNQNVTEMIATPNSCSSGPGATTNLCPASVTLSFQSGTTSTDPLPTATTLTEVNYDSSGDNLAQSSVVASSTVTVTVPTPTIYGTSYLVVQDASGNIYGVAEFTVTYVPAPTDPCTTTKGGSKQSCTPGNS